MSKSIKLMLGLGLAVVLSAGSCSHNAPQEEIVLVDPAPIVVEPVFTGKYK